MFDGDLFTDSQTHPLAVFYKSENKSSLEGLKSFEIIRVENELESDIVVANDSVYFTGSVHTIDQKFLTGDYDEEIQKIVSLNRLVFIDNLLEKTKSLSCGSFDHAWRFEKVLLEFMKEEDEIESFVGNLIRDTELRKIFDFHIIDIEDIAKETKKPVCAAFKIREKVLLVSGEGTSDIEEFCTSFFYVSKNFKELKMVSMERKELKLAEILNLLPYPMVLLNGEVVISHNNLFSKLNILPRVLKKSETHVIESEGVLYKLLEVDVDKYQKLFILIKNEEPDLKMSESKSELGIIAGSIAHELNNPVGGNLAAISLLELEDWDDENAKVLSDMKDSSKRCKELIETFLGFSKYRKFGQEFKSLSTVMEQATSLIRYRIVESGLNINIERAQNFVDQQVKSSVLPMVLYLLFNDLMTQHSHKMLVNQELGKKIDITLESRENCLVLGCRGFSFDTIDAAMLEKKLIHHLLEMEKMSLMAEGELITIEGLYDIS